MANDLSSLSPDEIRQWAKIEQDHKNTKVGFIRLFIILVILFIVAFFYDFKADYEYGWAWACFLHHWIIIPDWILSFFIDGKHCKPELYTSGYNVFWWIGVISWGISYVWRTIALVIYLFTRKHIVQGIAEFQAYCQQNPDEVAAALADQSAQADQQA